MHSFSFQQTTSQKLRHIYKQRLYNWLVDRRANMFMKPTDIISIRPTVLGYHEPYLEAFIRSCTPKYSDFFLDIGANIGLSTIAVGQKFRKIDCVEPNPLLLNVLRTNLAINNLCNRINIHPIGLGERDQKMEMCVPHDNFGGGFLPNGNAYNDVSNAISMRGNCITKNQTVEIRSAQNWFDCLFSTYINSGLNNGVIKIDVEGYEKIIFEALLSKLPTKMGVVVVMENFLDRFNGDQFTSKDHHLDWFYLAKIHRPVASIPFKLLGLSSSYRHELKPLTPNTKNPHDLVVFVG